MLHRYTCTQNTPTNKINKYFKNIWNLQGSVFSCPWSLPCLGCFPLYLILSLFWGLWFPLQTEISPHHLSNLTFFVFLRDSLKVEILYGKISYHIVTKESATDYKAPLLIFLAVPLHVLFSIHSFHDVFLYKIPWACWSREPFWIQIPKLFWILAWLSWNLLISHSWLTLE